MTLLHFLLPEISVLLKTYVKNPAMLAGLKTVLQEVQNDIAAILAGL